MLRSPRLLAVQPRSRIEDRYVRSCSWRTEADFFPSAVGKYLPTNRAGELVREIVDEGIADKRLLAQEAEFAGVLRAIERQGNTLSATDPRRTSATAYSPLG